MNKKKRNVFVESWLRGWRVIGRLLLLIAFLLFLEELLIPFGALFLVAICGDNKALYYPIGIIIVLIFIPFIFDIFNLSTGLLDKSNKCFDNHKTTLDSKGLGATPN